MIKIYRKIAVLLFAAAFGSAVSQDAIVLNCDFGFIFNEYICHLTNIVVLDPTANVTIGGDHIGNMTNSDVETVYIQNSTTPFIIPQIFSTFPFMTDFRVLNSGLETIDLSSSSNVALIWLYFNQNNISRIESGAFLSQPSVRYLNLVRNEIQELDENAFEGLEAVISLTLIGNHIRQIEPLTFSPLLNATTIDLERNNLTVVSEEMFSQTPNLRNLYLEYNQINGIAPNFAENLRDHLSFINLAGNECVNSFFFLSSDESWQVLNRELWTCFNNFTNGTTDGTRRITMEFSGHMTLFDEFGNMVVRF